MLEQLLLPLDGSGFGEETLPYAAALARSSGADVAVAHVHVPHIPDHLLSNTQYQYEGVDLQEYDGRDRDDEMEYLRAVAGRLEHDLGRPVQPMVLEGHVPEAIDDWTRHHGSGLIVMSTHGRTGLSRAWVGSVAEALVRHAPWPILLIRPRGKDDGEASRDVAFRRIMVPLDGSAQAERILEPVADLARATGAAVMLLRVMSPSSIRGTRVLPLSLAGIAEARREGAGYLKEVAGRLEARDIRTETRVVDHPAPARGILGAVADRKPDLVAMATHGYRGLSRVVLGSVADKILRGCETPLLLLGPGVGA